jgi:hypothetical protein
LGLLNAKILWYFLSLTGNVLRGGYLRFKTEYLKPFPIPRSPIDNPTLQKPLIALVDKILVAKNKHPSPSGRGDGGEGIDTSKWEAEIDARVFHLYGLTEEEMLTVLNSFPKMGKDEKEMILKYYKEIK